MAFSTVWQLSEKNQLALIWGDREVWGIIKNTQTKNEDLPVCFRFHWKCDDFSGENCICVSYYCFSLIMKDFIILLPVLSSSGVHQKPSLLHWHLVGFDQACVLAGLLILRPECLIFFFFWCVFIFPIYSCSLQKSSINIHWTVLSFFLDVWHSFNQGAFWKDSLPRQGQ